MIVVSILLQLAMWCFVATGMDGGLAWGVYSCALLAYWGLIRLAWASRFARGRFLVMLIESTGWIPPIGCGCSLLWLFGG